MITICGHEREALKWLLSEHNRLGVQGYTILRAHAQAKPQQLRYPEMAPFVDDITDPAKLVEMLAARGRELGLSAMVGDGGVFGADDLALYTVTSWGSDGAIDLIRDHNTLRGWDMRDARSILLQWLQLPDGAREEALLALGVTT